MNIASKKAFNIAILSTAIQGIFSGCAGPTTPLGAVWVVSPSQARGMSDPEQAVAATPFEVTPPRISFDPTRQVLHGPSNLKVKIEDTGGDLRRYQIRVHYNGADVSKMFLQQSRITVDRNDGRIVIENPTIRLPATEDNRIELSYRSSSGARAKARYEPPLCLAFEKRKVTNVGEFRPDPSILSTIDRISERRGMSPAFFTALVAQESGFNPRSVSWARAIGLTQVTALAEQEIREEFGTWQSFPGVAQMPFPRLKFMIESGTINPRNEWRLNEERSIEGGMVYVRQLSERWGSGDNLDRVREIYKDANEAEVALTQLVLASYNSGFSRVSRALDENGRDWLKSSELQEARKYVNRIFSYCHYFADSPAIAAGGSYAPAS